MLSNSSAGYETTHRNMKIGRDQSETKETVSQVVGVEQARATSFRLRAR